MKLIPTVIFILAIFTICCGGGGDDGGGGVVTPSISASFTAAKSNPDDLDVTLQRKSQSNDSFSVDVVITGVNNVFSASFDLVYDGTLLDYINYTEGDFLDGDGATTSFLISEQSGRLIVGASRLGQVGGINASGDELLMSIAFRVKKEGSTSVSFENNNLLNPSGTSIPGVEWFGGTAAGS